MVFNNIRLYITESCNAKCPNCFNRQNRKNQHMDMEHYQKICQFFASNGASQIKIMGGEPTIHPQFSEFMKISQDCFSTVSLFTNALSDNLYLFIPRDNDIITYNFKFRKLLNFKKLLLNFPGKRNLEIQITPTIIKEKLLEEIIRVVDICPQRIVPCFTLDCTANIFKDRDKILTIYEYIWKNCLDRGYEVGQDHLIPLCFVKGSIIPIPKSGSNCTLNCAGLIDSDYNLRFCNQHSEILLNMFDLQGNIIGSDSLAKALREKYYEVLSIVHSKGCNECSLYNIFCNGGCFAGKSIVEKVSPIF